MLGGQAVLSNLEGPARSPQLNWAHFWPVALRTGALERHPAPATIVIREKESERAKTNLC